MRVYKIKTDLTLMRQRVINQKLMSADDYSKVEELESRERIITEYVLEDDLIVNFCICSEEGLGLMKYFMDKFEVKYTIEDITKMFLYGQVQIDEEFDDFENFLKESLDVDTILDKMNELGKDSLTRLDYEILSR